MKQSNIQREMAAFIKALRKEEKQESTVEKYRQDASRFAAWLGNRALCKEAVVQWKETLVKGGYAARTVNGMLTGVNRFLRFLGKSECCVKALKVQRQLFRSQERSLTRQDYTRLLDTAERKRHKRLGLLIETICATGIRVSEVKYITVEAVRKGRAEIALKGKVRTILLPGKLCRKLKQYVKTQKIANGEIFITKGGTSLSRKQIWAEMKTLCIAAGVEATKVFPHNLRHLFARTFYSVCRDMAKLADVLGHSSIETTRLYLISTGEEHAKELECTGLVL